MTTLVIKVVNGNQEDAERAMEALGINADLEFETGDAQYDYAELFDDDGNTIWSTDTGAHEKQSREFFDAMYS